MGAGSREDGGGFGGGSEMREEEAVGGGRSLRCSGGSPRFGEALGVRGAARAGGSGDRRFRGPRRGAAGDPARRARPRVRSACGWWLLVVWSLRLASGGLCAPRTRGTLQCLQVSVFANRSWARTDGLARLGELQVYGWRNGSDSIRFLKPWARGPFGEGQWDELQRLLSVYRGSFTRDMHEFVKMLRLDYPFEIQVSAGCELRPGNTSESFFHAAFQGKEIMSFQGTVWMPAPDAPYWVGRATKELNQDQGTRKTLQWLLNDTCPQFVRGLLEAGKSELEKQVRPEAWLSTGPSVGPGRLLLVCRVSGFHPKPVWVMWMRGEQEQRGTQRGDVLPHADGTWYLRVTLDVAAREAAGLSCRVRHSSLGGQDIIIHWEGSHSSMWLMLVALLGSLLMIGCLALWYRRHRSYQGIL
ncbi:antigen-presenting glycoprotein CD1d [Zalophus californianus]|uniref:Antigen-presenting glycoprotein CD1d n=1 Tax=Zalophus californianus TaxID=9704 RepID=A0A6J2EHK3_ZALCA|nr:antigen-presenting glycoprotein CD1d [Zalophus californianus]